jgi:hypothetical protein
MINTRTIFVKKLISSLACLLMGLTPQYSFAIDPPSPPASEARQTDSREPQAPKFSDEELEKLLAPIALYPDALLAQLLPASAYPLEIVQAQRWLDKNQTAAAKQNFSKADAHNWDPSVKALLRFPTVLKKLSDDLDWTTNLGDAIVNQPQDVSNVIQLLREKAQGTGTLKTTQEQVVTTQKLDDRDVVTIESPDPSVVYVPSYDPAAVYNPPSAYDAGGAVAAGLLTFGAAVAVGSLWRGSYWNWGTGAFYRPVWPGYPAWRPPYAGWRPGMPITRGGNINIGNDINIGNRPWRPDASRYRPGGRPPALAGNRPGIGGNRPGVGGGIGGTRPGGGVGRRAGIGGGANRPAARPRPVTRPVARPAARPRTRAATQPARHRPASLGARGGHRAFRPSNRGGFHGGFRGLHGGHGGFRGGGFHGGRGGFRGGRRSDFRLKHDITLLGHLDNGLGFYRFVYNGGEKAYVGVIAQEVQSVMPDAVARGRDGYLVVFYEKVGLKFQTYDQWIASGARIPTGAGSNNDCPNARRP